jgi:hypothetical protein
LEKQGLSIPDLAFLTDEEGSTRSEKCEKVREKCNNCGNFTHCRECAVCRQCNQKNCYFSMSNEGIREYTYENIRRWMMRAEKIKPANRSYKDLCKRLKINPVMTKAESEDIFCWYEEIKAEGADFNKKHPTKKENEIRSKVAANIQYEKDREEIEQIENEINEEIEDKATLKQFFMNASHDIGAVLINNPLMFYEKMGLELDVFHKYMQLNDIGKNLLREIINDFFESKDELLDDDFTKTYLNIKNQVYDTDYSVTDELLDELYIHISKLFYIIDEEYCTTVISELLNASEEDIQFLINFHSIIVRAREIKIEEGASYEDFVLTMMNLLTEKKTLKTCSEE